MSPVFALLAMISSAPEKIDPKATQGRWEGWGTSLCWMGNVFGDRDDVADLLFTTKTVDIAGQPLPGLGLSIVRYNAGSCASRPVDGRKMVLSSNILPYRQMEGFWLDPKDSDPESPSWDWTRDAKQRAMMQKAKARGADRFELFSNAPMWWMCANDNPSGGAKSSDDNLRPNQIDAFAHYLAAVAKRAQDHWGIRFTSVEPFNEPLSWWWDANGKQEGCHFSVVYQHAVIQSLRRQLDRQGLRKIPIAASDETYVSHAVQAWESYDPPTQALVDQINVHGYEGEVAPRERLRHAVGNRKVWMSEHGEGDASGIPLARNLNLDVQKLQTSAWCYWQPLDGGGWGLVESDMLGVKLLRPNPKYFVLAQFSRHIRPGMEILRTHTPNTLVAYDPRKKTLVVIATNLAKEGQSRALDLTAFSFRPGSAKRWITEPHGTRRYALESVAPVGDGHLQMDLPAESVSTYEFSGVRVQP